MFPTKRLVSDNVGEERNSSRWRNKTNSQDNDKRSSVKTNDYNIRVHTTTAPITELCWHKVAIPLHQLEQTQRASRVYQVGTNDKINFTTRYGELLQIRLLQAIGTFLSVKLVCAHL